MSNAPVDNGRRRFLTVSTSVVGAVGVAGYAVPFLTSWNPSEKAKAAGAPVLIENIDKLEPGQMMRVEWRSKPVYVVRRTQEMIDQLAKHNDQLRDPASEEKQQPSYVSGDHRSIKPEYFIAVGICTHLGCAPAHEKNGAFEARIEGVKEGFFCPCHGSKFDIAGRVFQGVPAPTNLQVPPHYYVDDTSILVGEDGGQA